MIEITKCAYESSDDAYRVFRMMVESGHPPDDWNQLLAEARTENIVQGIAAVEVLAPP